VDGEPFSASDEADEWFGKGIYFWEYAFKQAWWWARDYKRYARPAVVGALIQLGNCFDLLDPQNVILARLLHDEFKHRLAQQGVPIPANVRHRRNLDCGVFNYIYQTSDKVAEPIESARGVYIPTPTAKRAWPGSWISEEAHVQVCVRTAKAIRSVWHVRPDGTYGKLRIAPP
jgi:hypothetical protein